MFIRPKKKGVRKDGDDGGAAPMEEAEAVDVAPPIHTLIEQFIPVGAGCRALCLNADLHAHAQQKNPVTLLAPKKMSEAVQQFVEKNELKAISDLVEEELQRLQKVLIDAGDEAANEVRQPSHARGAR